MEKLRKALDETRIKGEVLTSEAMFQWKAFQQARSSYLIFLDNSRAVRISIKKLNLVPLGDMSIDKRWRLQRELVKDLHNVIVSGQNFLDHLKHTHKFNEAVHEKDYSIFFRELRNFLVHNDAFPLVTRNEYKREQEPKFYQAMDKSTFYAFVNKKGIRIFDKFKSDPAKLSKSESVLLSELLSLLNFLDDRETYFDFEPILYQYTLSLNAYYSKWVLNFLKKKVKLTNLTKFTQDMEAAHLYFNKVFSESRLRYLGIAIIKKKALLNIKIKKN